MMKASVTLSLLAVAGWATAEDPAKMDRLMSLKLRQRETQRTMGFFDPGKYSDKHVKCENGKSGEYSCNNVDMYGFLSHEEMGSATRMANDCWVCL